MKIDITITITSTTVPAGYCDYYYLRTI